MNTGERCISRVVIFTDSPGWHGESLRQTLLARDIGSEFTSLAECRLDFSGAHRGICIPGFEAEPPDAAFVRGVPGGTLEQVVFRLDILHALDLVGVPVFNTGRAIERTVDKAMTTFLLHHRGIPTARTWVCESDAYAWSVAKREFEQGRSVVVKPVFGSQGEGVAKARGPDEFERCLLRLARLGHRGKDGVGDAAAKRSLGDESGSRRTV
jgi:hypothetical protein